MAASISTCWPEVDTQAQAQALHGALMDAVYRRQKHIYDATRKFYLFGRDTLIAGIDARPGMRVLEVGCGTGRNLGAIARRWPGVRLYGLDISEEMLAFARARLHDDALLAQGDATDFDPAALFGADRFDRIVFSFTLSMIPQWREALAHGAGLLAPGGSLHVVDFGDLGGLPPVLRRLLEWWLARFHVTRRPLLPEVLAGIGKRLGLGYAGRQGPFGYFRLARLARPAD